MNVFLRFGAPKRLISDNATNFRSQLWNDVARELGVRLDFVSPYTSPANGMAEVSIKSMRIALSSMQLQNKREWDYNLPATLFALNNTVNRHAGVSPHHILFGRAARLPIDNVAGKLTHERPLNEIIGDIWRSQNVAIEQARIVKEKMDYRNWRSRPDAIRVDDVRPGTVVFWQKKDLSAGAGTLAPKFFGPYKVITCDAYTAQLQHLETGEQPKHRVNIDQLKPFHFVPEYMEKPHFSTDDVYRAQPNRFARAHEAPV